MPSIEEPPEPWRSFFAEVDSRLSEDVYLHCCGGFVVTQLYGVARTTNDVDFLGVVPNVRNDLIQIAGKGELRPNLMAHEAQCDLTLRLWLESYWPV